MPRDLVYGKTFKYALAVIDVASRYKEAEPLITKSALEVSKAFEKIYDRSPLSYPKILNVDGGGEFKAQTLKLFKTNGTQIKVGEPGNHRAQGIVERFK